MFIKYKKKLRKLGKIPKQAIFFKKGLEFLLDFCLRNEWYNLYIFLDEIPIFPFILQYPRSGCYILRFLFRKFAKKIRKNSEIFPDCYTFLTFFATLREWVLYGYFKIYNKNSNNIAVTRWRLSEPNIGLVAPPADLFLSFWTKIQIF